MWKGDCGSDVLKGADMLNEVAANYQSNVEYAENQISNNLKDIARIHTSNLGTRIFYTSQGGYDTHANELPTHSKLIRELSNAVADFMDDLEEHNLSEDVLILVFTEFGRRGPQKQYQIQSVRGNTFCSKSVDGTSKRTC